MRKNILSTSFILAVILLAFCGSPSGNIQKSGKWQSYSRNKQIERRVDSVLKLMTLEEKIGQMTQFSANWSGNVR